MSRDDQSIARPQVPLAVLARSRAGRIALHVFRWSIPAILIAYLGYRLTQLGWAGMWTARPRGIWFYVLLVAQFLIQPLCDLAVYRNLWGAHAAMRLPVFLRKRLLNSVMLEYSGEVFFYFWARRTLGLPTRQVVHAIKDSNLLSAGAALAMVWLVLLALVMGGALQLPGIAAQNAWLYGLAGSAPLVLCAGLVVAHRKVTVLTRAQIAQTFAIHWLRGLAVLAAEFALWQFSGALPSAAQSLQFVAMRLVIGRIPLLPNRDLMFVGAGIAVAQALHLAVVPVAAVLVILAAAELILGCLMAGLPWAYDHVFRRAPAPDAP